MTMAAVRTSLVTKDHAWTGEDVPWKLDTEDVPDPATSELDRGRWRLFRYLSGGGLSACGSSSARARAIRRLGRFLAFAGFLGVLWILFWIV